MLALALLVPPLLAAPARAEQPLLADLSSHLIAITTGFTGTSVVLFGATDGPGEVVAVVRGPERDVVVREKGRRSLIWMNRARLTFAAVPAYYAVLGTRPLAEVATQSMAELHQIGLGNLRLEPREAHRSPGEVDLFRSALLEEQERAGLYSEAAGHIAFLGDRLFRATIAFPANVPTGTYLVEIFLIRDGTVVSGQTTPLEVSQTGFDAGVGDFAERLPLLYGVVAVAGAVVAGWLASLPFRNA